MWPSRAQLKQRLVTGLQTYDSTVRPLLGLRDPRAVDTLAMQFVASLRREDYYRAVQRKAVSAARANPNGAGFDAERAAAHYVQAGNIDEAAWLLFLMTYFGRPAGGGWRRLEDVYGGLGRRVWDWPAVSANPPAFYAWLAANWQRIGGKFGNHRKYETLRPGAARNIATTVDSYIRWVGPNGHRQLFTAAIRRAGNDPHVIFDGLYQSMEVLSFGRLAKLDYLALIGRYGIAPISPGSAYLGGATGPSRGAKLLFDGRVDSSTTVGVLQAWLDELDAILRVGMLVMEDALCNWQKSPTSFVHFRG
jgi:hypothetical protein